MIKRQGKKREKRQEERTKDRKKRGKTDREKGGEIKEKRGEERKYNKKTRKKEKQKKKEQTCLLGREEEAGEPGGGAIPEGFGAFRGQEMGLGDILAGSRLPRTRRLPKYSPLRLFSLVFPNFISVFIAGFLSGFFPPSRLSLPFRGTPKTPKRLHPTSPLKSSPKRADSRPPGPFFPSILSHSEAVAMVTVSPFPPLIALRLNPKTKQNAFAAVPSSLFSNICTGMRIFMFLPKRFGGEEIISRRLRA